MAYSSTRYARTFNPDSSEPHKVSRSKIDFFLECPRCFYLSERFGVKRPSMAPFTLNVAVDALLKKEFDIHRKANTIHPLMKQYGIDAVPYSHKDIDTWRENFVGIRHHHKPTNLIVFGAVDDIWIGKNDELLVVDYKATAKEGAVDKLEDTRWHNQYRRQMEVYQWLLRQNGFKTSNTGYFVYANGKKDKKAFDGKLEFDIVVIGYTGNEAWIEPTLQKLKECLLSSQIPSVGEYCEYCPYRESAGKTIRHVVQPESIQKTIATKKSTRKSLSTDNDIGLATLF